MNAYHSVGCVHRLCTQEMLLLIRAQARRLLGGVYELVIEEGSLKLECAALCALFRHHPGRYVFWVAKYAHLLLPFFDYLLCDGSHGFSTHGWKYIPICCKTSGAWVVPFCAVWGLEEETTSLLKIIALMRQHCEAHGVDATAFDIRESPEVKPLAACLCTLTMFAGNI